MVKWNSTREEPDDTSKLDDEIRIHANFLINSLSVDENLQTIKIFCINGWSSHKQVPNSVKMY